MTPTEPPRGMFGATGTGDTSGYGRLTPTPTTTAPISSPRPYGGFFDDLTDRLTEVLGPARYQAAVPAVVIHHGQLTLHITREHLLAVATALRDDPALRFEFCAGVSGVHYPDHTGAELHAYYPLASLTHTRRISLEVSCPDTDPHIPSLFTIYPTTDWHERETYDFFGIIFDGHPALTRIHMPDDWQGHPQRKDYPLGGIPVQYHGAHIPPPDQRRTYH